MTQKKTHILEILLEKSKSPKTNKATTERFVLAVLCATQSEGEYIKLFDGDRGAAQIEHAEICNLLCERLHDPQAVKQKIEEYLVSHEDGFLDGLYFDSYLKECMLGTDEEKSVGVPDVLRKILLSPTAALTEIVDGNSAAADESEEESESYSDLLARILGAARAHTEEDGGEESQSFPEDSQVAPPEEGAGGLSSILKLAEHVRSELSQSIVGQDNIIGEFVSGLFQAELTARVFEHRDKPRATFLFAGPPGVGKTYLAECAGAALKLPYRRFDMSEYSDREANYEFCGSDKVYKNGHEGNVTGFVSKNPHCVLLFDEIEKAHLNVIHLLLQMLDAGRLRDNFTDAEVSFTDAIVIFTTNVGKRMYEDESINLATVSRKSVLKALSSETDPETGAKLFPAAICSRFASGNVFMFNRLEPSVLVRISQREIDKNLKAFGASLGIDVKCDPYMPYVLLFSEGGRADARSIKGRSAYFIYSELYELLRKACSGNKGISPDSIKSIKIGVDISGEREILSLFKNDDLSEALVFTDAAKGQALKAKIKSCRIHIVSDAKTAGKTLEKYNVSIILCDILHGLKDKDVIKADEVKSLGMDFMTQALATSRVPVYALADTDKLSKEEYDFLTSRGVAGIISPYWSTTRLDGKIKQVCDDQYLRASLLKVARANKVLKYETLQKAGKDGANAEITLCGFKLSVSVDAEDNDNVLSDVDRPNVKFADVIGAKDAKEELSYIVDYLKNPAEYAKRGIKPPKGILLYGPSGTGKTLLAKAVAGESNAVFLHTEGNAFMKKYVGEGPGAVHELFTAARKYAPSILFIDEIDAIAKDRNTDTRSDDVLTAFLSEMDGFSTDKDRPVFVLAATNYGVDGNAVQSLDPALLRRFDRRILIDLPDKDERLEFIRLKASSLSSSALTKGMMENIAVRSAGASLADLDSVFEFALRSTFKTKKGKLTDDVLEEAFETYNGGEIKKWSSDDLLRTARHEAGHALLCWDAGETPSYVTVVARGGHGGYMQHGDSEGKGVYTKAELLSRVRTALGGRAAELVYYGDEDGLSSGASGDLLSATAIVREMIISYGMDEKLGLCALAAADLINSPYYSTVIARISEQLSLQLQHARRVIENNRAALDALAEGLIAKNSLKSEEIEAILKEKFVKTN